MHITIDDTKTMPFKTYRKTTLTRARRLTEHDYFVKQGTIYTLEGPASFEAGDYLCYGVQSEMWPVKASTFQEIYEYACDDKADLALYRSRGIKEALPIWELFTITMQIGNIHHGKPGDYLARTSDGLHIVDRDIFEATHELIEG